MEIHLEQLVYGSFPFWDRGYDVLARSPGCRADCVAEVLAACRRFGDAPSGVTPAPALFSLALPSGPRAIVGVEPQGADDRGRPGALAFHALLVEPGDYRKAGSNPFAFAGALRRDWSAEATLAAISWPVEPSDRQRSSLAFVGSAIADLFSGPGSKRSAIADPTEEPATRPDTDSRARRIVAALSKGRRVALESLEPIDLLAREVWPSLPGSVRRNASVATWAFGNANRFDLVALPRLAGVELDRDYLDPASIDAELVAKPGRSLPYYYKAALTIAGLAVIFALGLAWDGRRRTPPAPETPATRPIDPEPTIGPEERARIVHDLEDLADRLEIGGSNDPGDLMARISDRFHYRGPTLKPPEVARLAAEGDPDRDRALAWHERITRTFADDRPLPEDFAKLPLDQQLDRVAWSFHLAPSSRPETIPAALLEALVREGPIRPTPLAARYPPLSDYARFLGKLPRRR
jgi:hypothetical protein